MYVNVNGYLEPLGYRIDLEGINPWLVKKVEDKIGKFFYVTCLPSVFSTEYRK